MLSFHNQLKVFVAPAACDLRGWAPEKWSIANEMFFRENQKNHR